VSKKGAPRRYTVQRYIDEAAKEPFVLWLDEEVATFAETEEDADLIMEVFADAPAGAIRGFAKDVQEHFGLGG
jgi:hypothetical protein